MHINIRLEALTGHYSGNIADVELKLITDQVDGKALEDVVVGMVRSLVRKLDEVGQEKPKRPEQHVPDNMPPPPVPEVPEL